MPDFTTFIGVNAGNGRKPFTYVALDKDRRLLAVGGGGPVDVLSFAAGQPCALIGLSAPTRPGSLKPAQPDEPPLPVFRLSGQHQYQLDLTGEPQPDPNTGFPAWLSASLGLVSQFQSLGYRLFPAEGQPHQWLETPAESAFSALLGLQPFEGGTLEGRIQRQLVLFDLDLDVPDAMDFFEEITRFKLLHGHLPYEKVLPLAELNAWLAANTAWQAVHQPEKVRQAGKPESGQVVYPIRPQEDPRGQRF
jgi:hypothetical protein